MTTYYKEFQKVLLSVDCIIFGFDNNKLKILIGRRQLDPGRGEWSLYGGFVRGDESLDDAANRTLYELTGLKKAATYRAYVKAWEKAGGKKRYIGEASPTVSAITGGYTKSRCNPKAVTVKKPALSLKVGKTAAIKATVKGVKAHREVLSRGGLVRFYSSDVNVAAVNGSGKVTAMGPGKCTIWVLASNGVRTSVKVTVK